MKSYQYDSIEKQSDNILNELEERKIAQDSEKPKEALDAENMRKVPLNAIIEQENKKINRLNTLVMAVTKSSDKNTNKNENIKISYDRLINNLNKTPDNVNGKSNLENESVKNLLKQISNHKAKMEPIKSTTKSDSSSKLNNNSVGNINTININRKEIDEKEEITSDTLTMLTDAILKLLLQLEIKFPGKTSKETKQMLNRIYSKLEMYTPHLANYWMVKLDDKKRLKVKIKLK
jgi:hypothetical protein